MSDAFDIILPDTLLIEGGYSSLGAGKDRGGETYQGISRNNFPNWDGWKDVDAYIANTGGIKWNAYIPGMSLTDKVRQFYHVEFWKSLLLDQVMNISVAQTLFDMAVNSGKKNAVKLMQRVLNISFGNKLTEDGVIGPKTIAAINAAPGSKLFAQYNLSREAYYRSIAYGDNLNGWLKRIAASKAFDKKKSK